MRMLLLEAFLLATKKKKKKISLTKTACFTTLVIYLCGFFQPYYYSASIFNAGGAQFCCSPLSGNTNQTHSFSYLSLPFKM